MATYTLLATSQTWLSGALSWSTLGYVLLAIGMVAAYFSSRRYLLGYLLAGMAYWLVVEGIQTTIVSAFSLGIILSYTLALIMSWIALGAFMVYRINYKKSLQSVSIQRTGMQSNRRFMPVSRTRKTRVPEKYIEHTPIYNNYEPRFRN